MKRFLIAAAVAAVTIATPALAADVGVSISIVIAGMAAVTSTGMIIVGALATTAKATIQTVADDH